MIPPPAPASEPQEKVPFRFQRSFSVVGLQAEREAPYSLPMYCPPVVVALPTIVEEAVESSPFERVRRDVVAEPP